MKDVAVEAVCTLLEHVPNIQVIGVQHEQPLARLESLCALTVPTRGQRGWRPDIFRTRVRRRVPQTPIVHRGSDQGNRYICIPVSKGKKLSDDGIRLISDAEVILEVTVDISTQAIVLSPCLRLIWECSVIVFIIPKLLHMMARQHPFIRNLYKAHSCVLCEN